MKANELMLGDWIQTPDGPNQVYKILDNEIWVGDFKASARLFEGQFQPIPLTAEIQEKNFPSIDSGLGWFPDGVGFNCDTSYSEGDILASGFFRYVHELQHALRLCGIEKEIEL